jgi:hypothetical protein
VIQITSTMAERYQMSSIEFENFLNDSQQEREGMVDMYAEIHFIKNCGCKVVMGEYDMCGDTYKCRIKFCKNHEHYEIIVTQAQTKYILQKYNVYIVNF